MLHRLLEPSKELDPGDTNMPRKTDFVPVTSEHFDDDAWFMIAENTGPVDCKFWDGHGWVEGVADGWKTNDEQALTAELVRMSALDEIGQPVLIQSDIYQETEGPHTGKWCLAFNIHAMMRGEELNRGCEPWE